MLNNKISIDSGILLLISLINIIQISCTHVFYDEAYYWVYSNFLDWGYYDHPPLVALCIYLGELFGHGTFFTRIVFWIMSILGLYISSKMVLSENRKALYLGFFSLPLLSSFGIVALPDTPLLFFSILFWYYTEKYIDDDCPRNWVLVSVMISFLLYSKYHGLVIVLLTLFGKLNLLKRKSFYYIVSIVLLLYSPHIYWQYIHDFVSIKFHLTGRVQKHFSLENIGHYCLSVIAVSGLIGFFYLLKSLTFKKIKNHLIFFNNSYGLILFTFILSLRNQIEINWIVTACGALLIFHLKEKVNLKKLQLSLIPSLILVLFLRVVLIHDFGYKDTIPRLNEVHGWQERFKKFNAFKLNDKIVFDNYQYGAIFSYEKNKIFPVRHLFSRDSQYTLLNLTRRQNISGEELITFIGTKSFLNSFVIETNFKDPVMILKNTTISSLEKRANQQ